MSVGHAAASVRGIEHIGLCVPDIEAATRFFIEALGAVVLYDLLDAPVGGPPLARMVGTPDSAKIECIRMLRLGEGPNIELFQYSHANQRDPARHCDFGIQHFGLYVDDIEAVVSRLVEAGCRVPGGINDLPGGDSGPGNRFAYLALPWGGWIELIVTPSALRYEATTPLRRWRPQPPAGLSRFARRRDRSGPEIRLIRTDEAGRPGTVYRPNLRSSSVSSFPGGMP